MKFRLIKLLCIVGAGIVGAVLVGDPLAAVLIAPFGWIAGKTIEVWSEARKVPVRTVPVQSGDLLGFEHHDLVEQHTHMSSDPWPDIVYDPSYSMVPGNVFYQDD